MKKIYILLCAMAALAAASCTEKEEFIPTGEMVTREFTTLLTKTTLANAEGAVHWEANDAISVFDGIDNNKFDIKDYTSPSASATFSGEVDAGATSFYAVYPYAAGNSLDGSTLTAEVPAVQTLKAGSFQSGAAVAVAYTEGTSLAFHQATAVLGITLADYMTNVDSIMFSGNKDDVYVAGKFSIEMASDGTITSVKPGTGSKKVVLTGTFEADQTYYLSFIPQVFEGGLTVTVFYGSGQTAVATSTKDLTTKKGTIYAIADFGEVKLPVASVAAITSFAYGTAQDIQVTLHEVTDVTDVSAPEGWTVAWKTNHFAVTPPTQAKIQETPQEVAPAGVIKATIRNDKYSGKLEVPVRLYGINSLDDLKALQDNAVMDDPEKAAPYLVDNSGVPELTLNVDLTLQTTDLKSEAIALHHNAYPINGNGRTVTYDNVTVTKWPTGFVQNLQNNVHDINFTGSLNNTNTTGDPKSGINIGALAARSATNNVTVTNVTSDVDITWGANSGPAYIGGLVGREFTGNKVISFVNCTVSGNITANAELVALGGFLGAGETSGTADVWTVLDGCTFNGSITYTPDASGTRETRIGGLIGDIQRQVRLTDCTSDGTIDIYMNNKVFETGTERRGVGGLIGRVAAQSGTYGSPNYMRYAMSGTNTSNTNITVYGVNASDMSLSSSPFQKLHYNLYGSTYFSPAATGSGTVTLYPYAGPEINGVASPVSFTYGETKDLDVNTGDLSEWTVTAALEGWTVNTDHITDGSPYITVTAPTQDAIKAGSAVGAGDIAFTATHTTIGAAPAGGSGQAVRLYGINNLAEANAFISLYDSKVKTTSDVNEQKVKAATYVSDYMQDGKIVFNADIDFGAKTNFIMHWVQNPIEGNNRTLTMTLTGTGGVVAFCQHLVCSVSNLNLAGSATFRGSYKTACTVASLAGQIRKELTIENVHSSMTLNYQPNNVTSRNDVAASEPNAIGVGGIAYMSSNDVKATITNCSYSGTIQSDYRVKAVGGIIAMGGGLGTYNVDEPIENHGLTTVIGCQFTGVINENLNVKAIGSSTAVGGIIGTAERNSIVEGCTVSGTINHNALRIGGGAAEYAYPTGGIIGKMGNVALVRVKDCTTTPGMVINVTNLHNTAQAVTATNNVFNKLIGSNEAYLTHIEQSGNTVGGTVKLSWYNNLLDSISY